MWALFESGGDNKNSGPLVRSGPDYIRRALLCLFHFSENQQAPFPIVVLEQNNSIGFSLFILHDAKIYSLASWNFFFPVFPGARNGNPLQYFCVGSHGQRSQVGYSPWGHKRVGHNLGTKPPPLLSLGLPVELLSLHGKLLTITPAPFPSPCWAFRQFLCFRLLQVVLSLSLWIQQASLVAQLVKNLPVMRETWVRSLGWEDPLEKGKATHSSILAWRIPWTV